VKPLLLDTHTWIWLVMGESLSADTVQEIEQAAQTCTLLLSAISLWELGMLVAKGRLELHQPLEQWAQQALDLPGLKLAPLLPAIALNSSFLSGIFHGDPADRLIVATALHYQAKLLTRDAKMLDYAQQTPALLVRKI